MRKDFDIHQWQAKFLKEESERIMTGMEYLQYELPHYYKKEGDLSNYEIADIMERYANYLHTQSK